jgi:uncharacterized protein (DUF2235 family)
MSESAAVGASITTPEIRHMPKKLVLCLDGTSNQYKKDNTNVVKLVALLDKQASDQLIYYQPGVGTRLPPGMYTRFRRWVLTRLDLAFATLLKQQVQDAYRFLVRYYEEGDEIFLFGFSRGAYTARVLAGMLHKVGVLGKGNEELIPFAWEAYRVADNHDLARGFQRTFSRKVRIGFLGVWDTVSSVRWAGKPIALPYTRENPSVDKVRHAVALDERRAYFRQNLWDSTPPPSQDVVELWFPGVHCDVGGGYVEEECGLSKNALHWMLAEIGQALAFNAKTIATVLPAQNTQEYAAPNCTATIHESLRGFWRIVEWIPKRIKDPQNNFTSRWILPRGRSRWLGPDAKLHASVRARMQAVSGYTPENLP